MDLQGNLTDSPTRLERTGVYNVLFAEDTNPVPQFLEVDDIPPDLASLVRRDLDTLIGHPLDLDELMLRLNRIWGQGRDASISYSLVDRDGRARGQNDDGIPPPADAFHRLSLQRQERVESPEPAQNLFNSVRHRV